MKAPATFVGKPVKIEAMQLTRDNRKEILDWLGKSNYKEKAWDPVNVHILNEHGEVLAEPGDWVIKGSRGEFYPCKNSTFQEKYQPGGVGGTR